jgi:hypothetical protein
MNTTTFRPEEHPRTDTGQFVDKPTATVTAAGCAALADAPVDAAVDDPMSYDVLEDCREQWGFTPPAANTPMSSKDLDAAVHSITEVARVRAELHDLDKDLAARLADQCGDGAVIDGATIKIGSARDRFDTDAVYDDLVVPAVAARVDESSTPMEITQAAVEEISTLMSSPHWSMTELTRLGIDAKDYAEVTWGDRLPVVFNAPKSTRADDIVRTAVVNECRPVDSSPEAGIDAIRHIRSTRAELDEIAQPARAYLASQIGSGMTVKSRHTSAAVEVHTDCSTRGWNHDALRDEATMAIAAKKVFRAPPSSRIDTAVAAVRHVFGDPNPKKTALKNAGVDVADYHATLPGLPSVKF